MNFKILFIFPIIFQINAIRNIDKRNDENTEENFTNITSRQSGHITFEKENRLQNDRPKGLIKFEEDALQDNLVAFENNHDLNPVNDNQLVFDEPSQQQNIMPQDQIEEFSKPQKKKRRRRRKPKRQNIPGQYGLLPGGIQNYQNPNYGPGPLMRPIGQIHGSVGINPGSIGPYPAPHPRPVGLHQDPVGPNGYPIGHPYPRLSRPPRRRKPANLAEDALISVTQALGSIAQYDDYQCVPRLLCEVAGGKTPGGVPQTPSILPSFIDLQPLITLLAAFNGLSSSPLFVFGRAVFLGITSKGNTGTCRYAYPQCPTDPDQLVDYLNNHNGGFFRFFNGGAYQNHGHQNLQQFYSQLSGAPGYGGFGTRFQNLGPVPNGQNYGLHNPAQNFGFNPQFNELGPQNYGLYNPASQYPNYPNGAQYGNPQGSYGFDFPYNKNANLEEIKSNEIEKRIQNNPSVYVNTEEINHDNAKLTFSSSKRVTKSLRFPEEVKTIDNYISYNDYIRNGKGFQFPGTQSNRQYIEYYNYPPYSVLDENRFKLNADGYYVMANDPEEDADGDTDTIYVLRGNGDPNNPEVIKLKHGQKVSDLTNL